MSPLATTTLDALFPAAALARALTEGLVRRQRHPHLPLSIFNYTEKCVYAGTWDEVTLSCRGLITDDTGAVVARPLTKFFNHGQPGAAEIALDEPVQVTDKADGSLGVIFPTPDGPAVATRGSFTSDQARHATELLRKRYPHWAPPTGRTVLVEIIYPANRIVVDYGGMNDLMLLGAVDITTGRSYGPDGVPDWPGPVVEVFGYATFAEALAAPARPGREGLVVHAVGPDTRVKIKYEDYLHLHRIIYGLHARGIWEALGAGATVEQIAEPLPDEFHGWVTSVADRLRTEMATRSAAIDQAYADIVAALPDGWTRKDFALVAGRHELRAYLFGRLDGRDPRPALWQEVRPEANETPHGRTFDDE